MAGVDARCRFTMLNLQSPGSANDCIAWEYTRHYTDIILKKRFPPQYFYIGDEGFVNANSFLNPIPETNLNRYEDGYNLHLSRMRQNVERAFGLMVQNGEYFGGHCQFSFINGVFCFYLCQIT